MEGGGGKERKGQWLLVVRKGIFFTWQKYCHTLPPPAMAWFAESQAAERRGCESRSESKASVTAASSSCRLKSVAAWASGGARLRSASDGRRWLCVRRLLRSAAVRWLLRVGCAHRCELRFFFAAQRALFSGPSESEGQSSLGLCSRFGLFGQPSKSSNDLH